MKNMVVYAAVDDVRSSLHSMGLAWGDFSHTLSGASHSLARSFSCFFFLITGLMHLSIYLLRVPW